MIIIGITGTLGAGKGTIVDYLVQNKGFGHYSARAFVVREIEKRDMPVNRDSMVIVANDLRKKNSPSYIIDSLYEEALKSGGNSVIESIRTPGEVESLRQQDDFYLFAVDAPAKLRYERIKLRQSETDRVSYDQFVENEQREMSSTDPNNQNLGKCISMADYVFDNSGSIEVLNNMVEEVLEEINS